MNPPDSPNTPTVPPEEPPKHGYDRSDWQAHYETGDLKWDLGEVSPPLKRLWEEGTLIPGRMLVPGCGQGHEVLFFARQGFSVTGVDFAPGAVALLSRRLTGQGLAGRVICADFFALDASHNGAYDVILEQTFFCAIHPDDRERYVETVCRLLKTGGLLAGLFYETGEEGGPPFNTTEEDIRRHFSRNLVIERLEKCDHSVERREGKEWLAVMRKA